ncbi:unannotated protein [freshwater metagenome]|uniref:pyruvate kinase n=1 Tax=freshwater metagenome TaxID=449393 RepID=A0A6J6PQK1_9ZZZZ
MSLDLRRTKIVATLGPASETHEVIRDLVIAGMDTARLNFSHGSHADHAARAATVRAVGKELGKPLAILADLQGPKIRLGVLPEPRLLETGTTVVLTGEKNQVGDDLVVAPDVILDVLEPGHDVLIDDGLVRLRVTSVSGGKAACDIIVGGVVKSNKGVNLPGVPIPIPSLTPKDLRDLEFALELGVEYVALSFVRAAADVRELQGIIRKHGASTRVVSKIEKSEAIDDLDAILAESDALMVARGDLGVEIGAAPVPLLQKMIIKRALEAGKPVITATQMLESMTEHAEPTRAEASDVANAILDGTSAVMLSAETAAGKYPVEAVRTMDSIARVVEPSVVYRHPALGEREPDVRRAMSNAACDLAEMLDAKAILVATLSGRTVSEIARLRPGRPMIGLSHSGLAVTQMALEWGVLPLLMPETRDLDDLWARTIETARAAGAVSAGDLVVMIAGTAVNLSGSTNVIKVDIA